jgi:hypothetical protein
MVDFKSVILFNNTIIIQMIQVEIYQVGNSSINFCFQESKGLFITAVLSDTGAVGLKRSQVGGNCFFHP